MSHSITILGNGNMAFAIAAGLSLTYDLEIVGRSVDKLESFEKRLGIKIKKTLYDDFNGCDKDIVLCVKPANLKDIQHFFSAKINTLYSVLAGTKIEQLKQYIDAKHYIRAMPNLAANVQKSMTTLTGEFTCKDDALNIFSAIGYTLWVDSEKELDIATALAGSGPAFLALIAEALTHELNAWSIFRIWLYYSRYTSCFIKRCCYEPGRNNSRRICATGKKWRKRCIYLSCAGSL